mmetsp:Transcript_32992/g.60804  ORF Transcript_32992/g.60804 Transcript_32992/m.60804 type:complete len:213 (-) Transcript_32992:24-662(-)
MVGLSYLSRERNINSSPGSVEGGGAWEKATDRPQESISSSMEDRGASPVSRGMHRSSHSVKGRLFESTDVLFSVSVSRTCRTRPHGLPGRPSGWRGHPTTNPHTLCLRTKSSSCSMTASSIASLVFFPSLPLTNLMGSSVCTVALCDGCAAIATPTEVWSDMSSAMMAPAACFQSRTLAMRCGATSELLNLAAANMVLIFVLVVDVLCDNLL